MKLVGIDAGHGGAVNGARARGCNIVEKDLNLAVAKAIVAQANVHGLSCALIRQTDETLSFRQRAERARHIGCDYMVACHFDSFQRQSAHGMGCYYARGDSVSRNIGGWVLNHAPLTLRSARLVCAHDDPTRKDDDWLERPEAVVEGYGVPTLLIEFAFISNRKDLEFVVSPRGMDMMAWSAVMGLHRYALIAGA